MNPAAKENSEPMGSNYQKLDSPTQLQTLLGADLKRLSILYFRAEWAEICRTADPVSISKMEGAPVCRSQSLHPFDQSQLANEQFVEQIEAESLPDVAESFEVSSVPCFIILRGHQLLSRTVGAELSQLESDVEKFVKASQNKQTNGKYEVLSETTQKPQPPSRSFSLTVPLSTRSLAGVPQNEDETEEQLFARCKSLMQQSKVVVFMKGDPRTPRCGFSQQTVSILKELNVEFTTFDILTDEKVRQGMAIWHFYNNKLYRSLTDTSVRACKGMKKLNSWPTFPQIIINGELVGGLDILKEMVQRNGKDKSELEELLEN
ncbi:hypothetical protein VP01_2138g2 [Puccinia sorghi]|uniref:Glutaredoxin domain-containing protein n=1 Tax=Puccinia sorghi TaxID=27349 RepID=A0A0L6V9X5_9BASI|nr:hypothetical protein VP01_2138g2 [Puccinia sorghi]